MRLVASSIIMGFGLLSFVTAISYTIWLFKLPQEMLGQVGTQAGSQLVWIGAIGGDIVSMLMFVVGLVLCMLTWKGAPED